MAGFRFYKPGQTDRVRRNLDGTYLPQVSLQSPFTAQFNPASPFVALGCGDVFDKIQHQRTVYLPSAADQGSPFTSGIWTVNLDDPYPDNAYTVIVTAEDQNFSQSSPAMTPPAILVTSKLAGSVSGRLSFHPLGFGVNRPIVLDVLTIHN